MAKIGDHVDTIYGIGTVISGKRVFIHGNKDRIISFEGDKEREKKKRIIKAVLKTRLQVEEDMIYTHKKFLKGQKVIKEGVSEVKELKEKKAKPKSKSTSSLSKRSDLKKNEMIAEILRRGREREPIFDDD